MRAIAVHLNAGGLVLLGIGIAPDMVPPIEHHHLETELIGRALRDGQAEQASAHDHQVCLHRSTPS